MFTADFSHNLCCSADHGHGFLQSATSNPVFQKVFYNVRVNALLGKNRERPTVTPTGRLKDVASSKVTKKGIKQTIKESVSETGSLMDRDRLFQRLGSLFSDKAVSVFSNNAQSLKDLGSGVKSFIYCMKGQDH